MAQQPQVQYSQMAVTAQPVTQTTTVVVSQPTSSDWDTGLFGCFDDLYSCCCSFWLGPFYYGCVARTMGEMCCVGCSGHNAGCVPGGHIAMRSALRHKHGIPGSICGDCLIVSCCTSCAMCQMARQMEHLGYERKACC